MNYAQKFIDDIRGNAEWQLVTVIAGLLWAIVWQPLKRRIQRKAAEPIGTVEPTNQLTRRQFTIHHTGVVLRQMFGLIGFITTMGICGGIIYGRGVIGSIEGWTVIFAAWIAWLFAFSQDKPIELAEGKAYDATHPKTMRWANIIGAIIGLAFWAAIFGSFAYVLYSPTPDE